MCIAIVTTAHPDYPLILINNRDEYLHRPTDKANWWPSPDSRILGGRDLFREEHGTWLGITRQGRLACLTNFKEKSTVSPYGLKSRGAMVNAYLRTAPDSSETSRSIAQNLIAEGLRDVGGFSLVLGQLRRPSWISEGSDEGSKEKEKHWQGLAIVSNRSEHVDDVKWICTEPGETHALSNAHYTDKSWPKVINGEKLLAKAIETSVSESDSTDDLIVKLLEVLSNNTLPRRKLDEEFSAYLNHLKQSVFIPGIGEDRQRDLLDGQSPLPNAQSNTSAVIDRALSGVYGTQKQTVILVDRNGKVTYVERTLFDLDGKAVEKGQGDGKFEFAIEGW